VPFTTLGGVRMTRWVNEHWVMVALYRRTRLAAAVRWNINLDDMTNIVSYY
jgi:hypothetical protein